MSNNIIKDTQFYMSYEIDFVKYSGKDNDSGLVVIILRYYIAGNRKERTKKSLPGAVTRHFDKRSQSLAKPTWADYSQEVRPPEDEL